MRPRRGRPARSSAPTSLAPLCVILALLGVFGAAIGVGQVADVSLPDLLIQLDDRSDDGRGGRRSAPTRISIPAVGVAARVIEVGKADDGSIATPRTDPARTTGWYRLGPTPGEPGTAVIVGHVDTKKRPAVFQRLPELTHGTRIEVSRRDRVTAAFTVDSVETFPKTAFPTEKIFKSTNRPRLALVTCGGPWVGGDVGYADNVIVFATLT